MRKNRRPNVFIYYFLLFTVGLYFMIKNRVKIDRQATKKIKGPMIVIANHPSRPDFIYSCLALYKHRLNVVVARNYTYYPLLRPILKLTKAIPKNLFNPDGSTIKGIMAIIKKGGSVLIMPEGRLSTNGTNGIMPEGIEKLIQKMQVPVVNVHINGGYLTGAKWITKPRRGLIKVKTSIIITPEEAKNLSYEKIKQKVDDAISYNDFEWIQNNPKIRFHGRDLSAGLNSLLYYCPHCQKEFTQISRKNSYICNNCQYEVYLNKRYQFTPINDYPVYYPNILTWFEAQRAILSQQLMSTDYFLETEVVLHMPVKKGRRINMRMVGQGICQLNKSGLTYQGTIHGKIVKRFFPITLLPTLLFGCDEDFELYYDNHFYYFEPKTNKKQAVKWSLYSEVAYQIAINEKKQD